MTRKTSKLRKTGTVSKLTPNEIRLATANGVIWEINRTPPPKVISGTLTRGSRVTVEFNKNDGKRLEPPQPGKRTEFGTVIGLNAQQITLKVPSISLGHVGAGTQG